MSSAHFYDYDDVEYDCGEDEGAECNCSEGENSFDNTIVPAGGGTTTMFESQQVREQFYFQCSRVEFWYFVSIDAFSRQFLFSLICLESFV